MAATPVVSARPSRAHRSHGKGGKWAVFLFAALAACQAPKPAVVPPVSEIPYVVPGEAPGEAPGAAPANPATAALPPAPVINDNPRQLMGLSPIALHALLGKPELVRREAPAEIWQYRSETCVFDVFLYDDAGRRRVTYVEARDGAAQKIGARACLNELLRARRDQPLG